MSEEDKKDDNVRPLLRSVLAGSELAAKLTNEEFLGVVYRNADRNDQRWTLSMTYARAGWAGEMEGPAPDNPLNDNFLSVATFKPGSISRSKESFSAAHLVVLDDADPFQVYALSTPPSYVLETSPGNYQFGYLLTAPVTDRAAYADLMVALGRKKFVKQDSSGNNAIRVVRLPVGSNTKPEHKKEGLSPLCRLLQWDPTRHYDFTKLARVLAPSEAAEKASEAAPEDTRDEEVGMSDAEFSMLLDNIRNGVDYHDSINRSAARLVSRGTQKSDAKTLIRQLMQATTAARDDRWLQRYNDIGRAVDTAYDKFGPKVEAKPAGDLTLEQYLEQFAYSGANVDLDCIPRPMFLVNNWLPANKYTLFSGNGGSGKSSLVLQLAMLLASGAEMVFGFLRPTEKVRVLYLSAEDDPDVNYIRMRAIYRLHPDLDRDAVDSNLMFINLADADLVGSMVDIDERSGKAQETAQYKMVAQVCERFKPDLIIADNNSILYGGNEIVRRDIQRYLSALLRLHRGAAVLALHHVDKASNGREDGEGWSGSTQWHNGARARWTLSEVGGVMTLYLRKSNYGEKDWSAPVTWNEEHKVHQLGEFVKATAAEIVENNKAASEEAKDDALLRRFEELVPQVRRHLATAPDLSIKARRFPGRKDIHDAFMAAGLKGDKRPDRLITKLLDLNMIEEHVIEGEAAIRSLSQQNGFEYREWNPKGTGDAVVVRHYTFHDVGDEGFSIT